MALSMLEWPDADWLRTLQQNIPHVAARFDMEDARRCAVHCSCAAEAQVHGLIAEMHSLCLHRLSRLLRQSIARESQLRKSAFKPDLAGHAQVPCSAGRAGPAAQRAGHAPPVQGGRGTRRRAHCHWHAAPVVGPAPAAPPGPCLTHLRSAPAGEALGAARFLISALLAARSVRKRTILHLCSFAVLMAKLRLLCVLRLCVLGQLRPQTPASLTCALRRRVRQPAACCGIASPALWAACCMNVCYSHLLAAAPHEQLALVEQSTCPPVTMQQPDS